MPGNFDEVHTFLGVAAEELAKLISRANVRARYIRRGVFSNEENRKRA